MNIVRWSNECVCFFSVQIHVLPIFCVSFLWRSFPFRLALFTHKIFPLQSKWKSFECRFPLKMVKITLAKLLITGLFHFISCFFPFLFALRISTTTAADFSFIQSRSRVSEFQSNTGKTLWTHAREKKISLICFLIIFEKSVHLYSYANEVTFCRQKKSCYKATWFQKWNGIRKLFQPFFGCRNSVVPRSIRYAFQFCCSTWTRKIVNSIPYK